MNKSVKLRGYTKTGLKYIGSETYIKYKSNDELIYPEFLQFFTNLRYVVGKDFKSFAEFSRLISLAGLRVTHNTVSGYEKGFFKVVQYNWLFFVARFVGQNVHVMLTVDLRERDEREKLEASK